MFIGLHAMAAMQLQAPELAIADEEGKAFMQAAQNVLRHYSVETTQKTLDWVAFMGVCVGMYGTRVVAIANRRKTEGQGAGRKSEGSASIHTLRPVENPPPSPPASSARYEPPAANLGATLTAEAFNSMSFGMDHDDAIPG